MSSFRRKEREKRKCPYLYFKTFYLKCLMIIDVHRVVCIEGCGLDPNYDFKRGQSSV